MIKRGKIMDRQHKWPSSRFHSCNFAIIVLSLIIALASSARGQTFEQVIATALVPGNCDARMDPTGALAARICEEAGSPGASSGSSSILSRELVPVEEQKIKRLIGPFNVFISGEYERLDKDETTFEPGYTTHTGRTLIGADYSLTPRFVLGAAFQYDRDEGKFDAESPIINPLTLETLRIPRGRFNTDAYSALFFGNLVAAPQFFLNTTFSYTRKNYFISRGVAVQGSESAATGTAAGDTNGNEFKVGLDSGYNFSFASITLGPRLGLHYRHTEIKGYRERGNVTSGPPTDFGQTGLELIYSTQRENSLTSVLGVFGSVAISTSFGVLVPQTTLEYVHEFLDPQRKITFRFVDDGNRVPFRFENDPPDRNYFNLGAGMVAQLPHGFAPFVNYRALVGYKDRSSHTVTAGLRIEF